MENEKWKFIPDTNNKYLISNYGNVRSLITNKILRHLNVKGYHMVKLNCFKQRIYIHRLVALAFLGERPVNKPLINHINGIRNDNFYSNLEWCDHKYNCQHAFKTGLNKGHKNDNHPRTAFSNEQIITIFSLKFKEANQLFGISSPAFYAIKTGRNWGEITGKKYLPIAKNANI